MGMFLSRLDMFHFALDLYYVMGSSYDSKIEILSRLPPSACAFRVLALEGGSAYACIALVLTLD